MKRRKFVENVFITGISMVGSRLFANNIHNHNQLSPKTNSRIKNKTLTLEGEYYRHYPVDFSLGKNGALGFKGWGEKINISVPLEETALIPMHIWNVGLSPELPFQEKGAVGPVMQMLEWISRSVPIIKTEIPPILDAARQANMKIIHVASDEHYAIKYPGYKVTLDLAGDEPQSLPKAPRYDQIKKPDDGKDDLLFGHGFTKALSHYQPNIDFPEQARPRDDEHVVYTTHQLNSVLRHFGIWQLIYIGFAINWCLWFSPCGMVDMSRLGYRCSCIKEAVTAVENKESVGGELNKREALWRTSLMFGYIHNSADFIKSCSGLKDNDGQ